MSVLTDLIERVRSIIFRRRDERELAEELEFHTAMEAAKLERRGLSPAEARRRTKFRRQPAPRCRRVGAPAWRSSSMLSS